MNVRSLAAAEGLPPTLVIVLHRTPRHKWGSLVVVVDDEAATAKLVSRGELAAWCTANDLRALAAECLVRRVPPNALLLLHVGKDETRFRIVGGETHRPGVPRGQVSPPTRSSRFQESARDREARREGRSS